MSSLVLRGFRLSWPFLASYWLAVHATACAVVQTRPWPVEEKLEAGKIEAAMACMATVGFAAGANWPSCGVWRNWGMYILV